MRLAYEKVPESGAAELSAFALPIWKEVFDPMMEAGAPETDYLFSHWQSPERIAKDIRDGLAYYYVIIDGRRAGYCAVRLEGKKIFLSKVYLAHEFRGQGHGSEMLQDMFEYGKSKGCKLAYLHVNVNNAKGIAAYERNGMRPAYRLICSEGEGYSTNDYVMEKEL